MSSIELNKVFAAILCAGIIAMITGIAARILVPASELEENAYVVDTGAETHRRTAVKQALA